MARGGGIIAVACAWGVALGGCGSETPTRRPVVLIVVDTLRADRLDPLTSAPLAPELASRLASGRRYLHAFAPSPWTLPSFASLYTGRFPSRHGAGRVIVREGERSFSRLDDEIATLAERLAQHGYATGAIVGNAALAPEFGMARGFEHYDYAPATNAVTRRADAVVEAALEWIDTRGGTPFFLVVHLFDPHMNYDAPPPFRGHYTATLPSGRSLPVDGARALRRHPEAVSGPDRRFIAAAYDEEVAFATAQVARLLAQLEARDLMRRGLVVLTSDHGEELFEHEGFEHGHALWQEVLALPLVCWGAGVVAGPEEQPVSLVDLAPTILEATETPPLADPDGVSLWGNLTRASLLPDRALLAEGSLYGPERRALIRWPHKLAWNLESGEQRLYELQGDPGERAPLADAALRRELASELAAHDAGPTGAPAQVDSATRESLRELGYVE